MVLQSINRRKSGRNLKESNPVMRSCEKQVAQADEQIGELQQSMNDTGVSKEELEGQINVLREQIHTAQQNEEHVRSRVEALQADVDRQQKEGEDYSSRQTELEARHS